MHVRVELGQEAAVTAHAADGAARLQLAPAGSGGTSRGRRLAATHGSNGDLRRRMRCMRSIGCSLGRGRHVTTHQPPQCARSRGGRRGDLALTGSSVPVMRERGP